MQFPPADIQQKIKQKGFFVYPDISQNELFLTLKKDFLEALDVFKYMLLAAGAITMTTKNENEAFDKA